MGVLHYEHNRYQQCGRGPSTERRIQTRRRREHDAVDVAEAAEVRRCVRKDWPQDHRGCRALLDDPRRHSQEGIPQHKAGVSLGSPNRKIRTNTDLAENMTHFSDQNLVTASLDGVVSEESDAVLRHIPAKTSLKPKNGTDYK